MERLGLVEAYSGQRVQTSSYRCIFTENLRRMPKTRPLMSLELDTDCCCWC
jgi:hypothetical protein